MLDHVVLLSAGKPYLDNQPALLTEVSGKSIFDWQINAAGAAASVQLVLGYEADRFAGFADRHVKLVLNENWERSSSAYSYLCADLSGKSQLVSYADILYRPDLVARLRECPEDVVLVYDSAWRKRYVGRTEADLKRAEKVLVNDGTVLRAGPSVPMSWANGEFIGLVLFNETALRKLRVIQQQQQTADFMSLTLSDLVEWLRLQGLRVAAVDVLGDWAELNDPKDLAHFVLGTKAETLLRLSRLVRHSVVLPQVAFSVAQWRENPAALVSHILDTFADERLVVRSSAKSEDAFTQSNAGAYTSLLNVPRDSSALHHAIETVIASYLDCRPDDQVLIQPMLARARSSGVAFTRTLEHGAPFYVINYAEGGDTESITSGSAREHRSLYFRKDAAFSLIEDDCLRRILQALAEVESLLNYDALDIEFAVGDDGQVVLLQVRPIAVSAGDQLVRNDHVLELQRAACRNWQTLQVAAPHIQGTSALFGVMPDWNPAEIIGTNPGQLAISLYRYLILDDVWAQARAEYGYRDVRPQPLLRVFAGKPYIDIRASFNSFLPAGLPDDLAARLVDFYMAWLRANPWLHDKVEFEVVPTCFGPGFAKWEQRLREHAKLGAADIDSLREGLRKITQHALFRVRSDLQQLEALEQRRTAILNRPTLPVTEKVHLLLEDCKRFGTLPFAHLARSAFVAATLLREAVECGWLSKQARDGFMDSLRTVSHTLSLDAWRTAQGKQSWDEFVQRYGHLRPGTYDITSPAYWDNADYYLRPLLKQATEPRPNAALARQWQEEKAGYFERLRKSGLEASDEQFECFLRDAIEGREKAKFVFSKSLSAALSLLAKAGTGLGLTPAQLANLPYHEIRHALCSDLPNSVKLERLSVLAKRNKYERAVSLACQLPPLLTDEKDFIFFTLREDKPNFIGSRCIRAPLLKVGAGAVTPESAAGCIVLIPQADPGYDWLFGQKIAGLITMFGGANSHMAIRAAEFGLPAAIGVGAQLYTKLQQARTVELDPAGQTIRVLH